jgi:hypothetical protein
MVFDRLVSKPQFQPSMLQRLVKPCPAKWTDRGRCERPTVPPLDPVPRRNRRSTGSLTPGPPARPDRPAGEVGLGADLIQDTLDRRRKRRPEPSSALLVPVRRVVELGSRSPTEDNRKAHRWNRASASAFICSQGTTSSGLAACSANRRSNSSRCDSVSRGECGPAGTAGSLSS